MKITFDSNSIKETYAKRSESDIKSTGKQKKDSMATKNDSVNISEDALNLSESENKNMRVEQIKSSLENGTYKIDPKVIAEKMLADFELPE